jgi:hypothetical protein
MEQKEYLAVVDAFENAYAEVSKIIAGLSAEKIAFVPAILDAWSINDHLVHVLDADCNLVLRLRGAVAEPGLKVPMWDQEAWHTMNDYSKSDGKQALALAVAIRKFIAASLRNLEPAVREAANIVHPSRGKMSLVDVLVMYTNHASIHKDYVTRNLDAFVKERGK